MNNLPLLERLALGADWAELAIQINMLSHGRISEDNAKRMEDALDHVPTNGLEIVLNLVTNNVVRQYCRLLIKLKQKER